jgi:hypothetical protein
MGQREKLTRCASHGALVMLERSAGKLARSVLRGLGGREPTWLPGGSGSTGAERRYAPAEATEVMGIRAF